MPPPCVEDPEYSDYCWIEGPRPRKCEQIPEDCLEDPDGFEECIESHSTLCPYGGDVYDDLLVCSYVLDHCQEGTGDQWGFCSYGY